MNEAQGEFFALKCRIEAWHRLESGDLFFFFVEDKKQSVSLLSALVVAPAS